MTLHPTRKVSEAHCAVCDDCGQGFEPALSPYWSWRKSVYLHRTGSGHRVTLYTIIPEGEARALDGNR